MVKYGAKLPDSHDIYMKSSDDLIPVKEVKKANVKLIRLGAVLLTAVILVFVADAYALAPRQFNAPYPTSSQSFSGQPASFNSMGTGGTGIGNQAGTSGRVQGQGHFPQPVQVPGTIQVPAGGGQLPQHTTGQGGPITPAQVPGTIQVPAGGGQLPQHTTGQGGPITPAQVPGTIQVPAGGGQLPQHTSNDFPQNNP